MIQQVNESTLENHIQTIQDFGPHPTGSTELEEAKDTANLTIHIEMKNFFTGEYIEGPYNSSSDWIFQKEINDYWEFVLASHTYSFELINLEATIK